MKDQKQHKERAGATFAVIPVEVVACDGTDRLRRAFDLLVQAGVRTQPGRSEVPATPAAGARYGLRLVQKGERG